MMHRHIWQQNSGTLCYIIYIEATCTHYSGQSRKWNFRKLVIKRLNTDQPHVMQPPKYETDSDRNNTLKTVMHDIWWKTSCDFEIVNSIKRTSTFNSINGSVSGIIQDPLELVFVLNLLCSFCQARYLRSLSKHRVVHIAKPANAAWIEMSLEPKDIMSWQIICRNEIYTSTDLW